MLTIKEKMKVIKKVMRDEGRLSFSDKIALGEIYDWMNVLEENPPRYFIEMGNRSRVNNAFVFQCSDIKDPVDCGVYMLKPCIQKYFKDHNYSEATSKIEKQMAIIALCHRIEEGLIDYLDELEEFNS